MEDIKSRIPGQYWGQAMMALPPPERNVPHEVTLDIPGFGHVRFFCAPWSYNVHGGRNWAWQVTRAELCQELCTTPHASPGRL